MKLSVPPKAMCVIDKYITPKNFLSKMSPNAQKYAAENPERAIMNEISLSRVELAFGSKLLKVWLKTHLENLNDFAGVKQKMDLNQMDDLAEIIRIDYCYLKAAEILLFFHNFKKGEYGPLYGSVDPQLIATALIQYLKDRKAIIARIQSVNEGESLKKRRAMWNETAITREEYEKQKSNINNSIVNSTP